MRGRPMPLTVIARLDRAIQYTHQLRRVLGHPVKPGDDKESYFFIISRSSVFSTLP
jgi:hypothetical protein